VPISLSHDMGIEWRDDETSQCNTGESVKEQLWLIILLVLFVAAAWLLVFELSLVPAHARNPLDIQATPLE